jgi:hypothetical protein
MRQAYNAIDEPRCRDLRERYGAGFVVKESGRLSWPVAYENPSFTVYRVPTGGWRIPRLRRSIQRPLKTL